MKNYDYVPTFDGPLTGRLKRRRRWRPILAVVVTIALLITLALLLGGCGTTIRYNPLTGEVYYHSDTGKEFSDLSIIKEVDGSILIEVNKYRGEGIGAIVGAAVEGAVRGMKP